MEPKPIGSMLYSRKLSPDPYPQQCESSSPFNSYFFNIDLNIILPPMSRFSWLLTVSL